MPLNLSTCAVSLGITVVSLGKQDGTSHSSWFTKLICGLHDILSLVCACSFGRLGGQCISLGLIMICLSLMTSPVLAGKRMVSTDWAVCPSCQFPCRLTAFQQVIEAQKQCPMCNQAVSTSSMQIVKDPLQKSS